MESPTPVSRFITRNSKNRVFPGGSSSSGFKEVEVLEMPPSPPPINRTSKSKSSKQKAVIYHEIIDVDIEEDSGYIDRSGKGKEALSNFSAGVSNLVIDGSGNDIQMSNNGTVQDLNSNLFYGEDDWIDKYFDDIVFDDYAALQSYFDHMDIPPGVEAPFPWLPSSPQNDIKVPVTGASTSSSSQIELNGSNVSHDLYSSDSPLPSKPVQFKDLTTSAPSKIGMQAASQNLKGQQYSKRSEAGRGLTRSTPSSNIGYLTSQPSGTPLPHNPVDEPLLSVAKNKKRSRVYSTHKQFPSGATLQSTVNNYSGYPALSMPSNASGMGTYMPVWPDLPVNVLEPSMGPPVMNGSAFAPSLQDSAYNQNEATSARVEQRNVDEIFQNYDQFKKFDTVEDYSDHYYSKSGSFPKQPPKNWGKKIQEEWKILEKDLPDTIFVRVYESRMDLLRAVIVGAEGTPYHDGLFFFDVCFPSSYPNVPPQVHYHSGGLRINPNLYNCGKVCLSLLNTWSGSQKEKWIPGVSTMLQVLVSIQGLILNAKPYFNEPGYAHSSGTTAGEKKSLDYNENTFILSLRTMVYNMRRPPKYFEAYVVGHFCKHARDILVSCKAYLDGAQVGCLVKGGVQDVDEGDKSCSQHFRTDLAGFITTLANTFSQIGAKDCQEFLYLSQKANGPATAAPGPINFYH